MNSLHSLIKNTVVFIVVIISVQNSFSDTVSVTTEYGTVRGNRIAGVSSFLGIPFAKPPVGTLRWRAPVKPDNWSSIGAFGFKPECPQMTFEQGSDSGIYTGSEDCLHLNIWTPSNALNRPVLVFIHGGANQQGAASSERDGLHMYDGTGLAYHENVIVVTIQYRLGPLGFLVHPGLEAENNDGTSGNYAILDQILALKWVKKNITAFGGDSSKVMVFGESAGALNTCALLVTPFAAGLFSRALVESGAATAGNYSQYKEYGIGFIRDTMKCKGSNAEMIQAARKLSPESIVASMKNPLAGGIVNSAWGPAVDGHIIPEQPLSAISAGRFNRVPVIMGTNADEMSVAAPATVTPSMVNLLMRASVPANLVNEGLNLYPPGTTNIEARKSYVGLLTDAQFTVSARRAAQAIVSQNVSVYRYFFNHSFSGIQSALGAFHGIELFYVFRTLPLTKSYGLAGKITHDDSLVMNSMSRYWARFAETGNPNTPDLPVWPAYSTTEDPYLEIAPVCSSGKGLRKEKCDYWDKVYSARTAVLPTKVERAGRTLTNTRLLLVNTCIDMFTIERSNRNMNIFDIRGRSIGNRNVQSINNKMLSRGLYLITHR
jgi:para-nitrobenzyl esterase